MDPRVRTAPKDKEIHRKSSDVKQENATTSPPPTILSQEEICTYLQGRGPPMNAEVQTMLCAHNPKYASQRQEIDELHRELRQFSSERIDTAEQLKSSPAPSRHGREYHGQTTTTTTPVSSSSSPY